MFTIIYFEIGSNRINIHRNMSGVAASMLWLALSKQVVDSKTLYQGVQEIDHINYRVPV